MSWLTRCSFRVFSKLKESRYLSSRWSDRTHTCGELGINDVGKMTRLSGWVQYHRMGKFVVLRDAYGLTQCIVGEDRAAWDGLEALPLESVVAVEGIVRQRPPGTENNKLATGDIEVEVTSVLEANPCSSTIPFIPAGRDHVRAKEVTIMPGWELVMKGGDSISEFLNSLGTGCKKSGNFPDIFHGCPPT